MFTQRPDRLYHFAYGANMNKTQLLSRCAGKPEAVAVAKLPQHRLAFHGYSGTWDSAMETVVPAHGHEVWGVILKLTFSDGDRLDAWQDARLDGSGTYFHCPAQVIDMDGVAHAVLLYKKDILGHARPPSREYLDFIIQGALECVLPSCYIEELRKIDSKQATFAVPKRGRFDRGLLAGMSCSDCGG